MSNNTKIFSEAIAEAKAIRETAMTNAKLALEEAFAPRMQEMMSNKLEALAEEDEEMDEEFKKSNGEAPEDDSMDEISLEELIAELDGLEEGETEEVQEEGQMEENTLAEAEDDDTVGEITVDDLKDIIRDVVADLMGGSEEAGEEEGPEEEGPEEEEAGEEEAPEEGEDEINLEEILAELDSLNENEEVEEELEEGVDIIYQLIDMFPFLTNQTAQLLVGALGAAGVFGLSAIVSKITDMAEKGTFGEKAKSAAKGLSKLGATAASTRNVAESKELEEAMSTIATLRSELNEVNLLNAKLLYVNKLFKSKNLTEAQKVKVINAFDRAETVK